MMESFEEKLNKYTDRNELISHLKYLKDIGVIPSVKSKGKETYELVMNFLESVETIEKDSEVERKVVFENQSLVIMYNTLASKVEKLDIERMTENGSAPFRASFNVSVKDRISGHSIQRQGQYTFGEW